jgi:hypothetical protein
VATSPDLPIVRRVDESRLMDARSTRERDQPVRPSSRQNRARRLFLIFVVAGLVALVEAAWLAVIALVVVRIANG